MSGYGWKSSSMWLGEDAEKPKPFTKTKDPLSDIAKAINRLAQAVEGHSQPWHQEVVAQAFTETPRCGVCDAKVTMFTYWDGIRLCESCLAKRNVAPRSFARHEAEEKPSCFKCERRINAGFEQWVGDKKETFCGKCFRGGTGTL